MILIFGVWTIIALADFGQALLWTQSQGKPFAWPQALLSKLITFDLWAVFSIMIIRLGQRYRLDRTNRLLNAFKHLGFSISFACFELLITCLNWEFFGFSHMRNNPFWTVYLQLFTRWFVIQILLYWCILGVAYAFEYYSNNRKLRWQLLTWRKELRSSDHYIQRLAIKENGHIYFVKTGDVDWIEAADYYVLIHSKGQSHLLRESLAKLEQKLDPARFIRIHRSAIVNMERVKAVHSTNGHDAVVLQDHTELALSRRRKHKVKTVLDARKPVSKPH